MYESMNEQFEVSMRHRGYAPELIERWQAKRQLQQIKEAEEKQQRLVQAELDEWFRGMPKWVQAIVVDVAAKHEISPLLLFKNCRVKRVTRAKTELGYRIKAAKPMLSSVVIAKWLGRDHTVVLYWIAAYSLDTGAPRLSHMNVAKSRQRKAALGYERVKAQQA